MKTKAEMLEREMELIRQVNVLCEKVEKANAAANQLLQALKTIQALAENAHWTSERRWKIAQVAQNAIAKTEREI